MLAGMKLGRVIGSLFRKRLLPIALRLIVGASIAMANSPDPAQAETAFGDKTPVVSYNLAAPMDWEPAMPFIDLMKTARPWIGNNPGQWGAMQNAELHEGGYIDADGWLTSMPEGVDRVETMWSWDGAGANAGRAGTYVLEYEGSGTIAVSGKTITVKSSEPGRIVFENTEGGFFFVSIHDTDPGSTGDYIRDITVMRQEHETLYDVGAVFNPEWLEVIENAHEIRFMDWMRTNNSQVVSWDDMPGPDQTGSPSGVAVEYMVQLANETGAIPWFNMPHLADEEYIRNFATYVRDNLDPALQVKVEYSNETWNWAFEQTQWLLAQSKAEWGEGDHVFYAVKKAVETALIWEEVFAETGQEDQLVNVLGVQTANVWSMRQMLDPWKWKQYDPEGYVDPTTVFEEVAVTNYFGGFSVTDATARAELLAAIEDPAVDATAFLAERLMDPDFPFSVPSAAAYWQTAADLIHEHGLKMVAYEGGQHVHHSFAVAGLTEAEVAALNSFMIEFVRSDAMAELYKASWEAWAEVSDGPFMQFGEVGAPSKWGSWGLYSHLGDINPRGEMLDTLARTVSPWWEAEGGEQFQQGVTARGDAGDDVMVGSFQEDYLAGLEGDDVFLAGRGDDGINGGAGTDRLILSGKASQYSIRAEGAGYRIDGPDGSDFILDVEELEFESGQVVRIDALRENADGTFDLPDRGDIKGGQLMNGQPYRALRADDLSGSQQGIRVQAIETGSAIGQSLGLDDAKPAYATFVKAAAGAIMPFITRTIPETSAAPGGDGPFSLLDTVLQHGGVVTNAPRLVLTRGNDEFHGMSGTDEVRGGQGADRLLGNGGADILRGNAGADQLYGQAGDDRLLGNGGRDLIDGGRGDDILTGGRGADRFVFRAGDGDDVLRDFSQEDLLVLDGFLSQGQSLEEAASMENGALTLSNGQDSITLRGLDLDALDWMNLDLG